MIKDEITLYIKPVQLKRSKGGESGSSKVYMDNWESALPQVGPWVRQSLLKDLLKTLCVRGISIKAQFVSIAGPAQTKEPYIDSNQVFQTPVSL